MKIRDKFHAIRVIAEVVPYLDTPASVDMALEILDARKAALNDNRVPIPDKSAA